MRKYSIHWALETSPYSPSFLPAPPSPSLMITKWKLGVLRREGSSQCGAVAMYSLLWTDSMPLCLIYWILLIFKNVNLVFLPLGIIYFIQIRRICFGML